MARYKITISILLFFIGIAAHAFGGDGLPMANKGIIDLRNTDLNKTAVPLTGNGNFIGTK